MTRFDEVEFEIRDREGVVLSFSSEDMSWDEFLAWYGGDAAAFRDGWDAFRAIGVGADG